jgi:hypothetical protein
MPSVILTASGIVMMAAGIASVKSSHFTRHAFDHRDAHESRAGATIG